jgi:hypothetical protein
LLYGIKMEKLEERLEHFYHHTIRALTQVILGVRDIEMSKSISGEEAKILYYNSVKRFVDMVGKSAENVRADLPNDNQLSAIFDGYITDIQSIKDAFEARDYETITLLQAKI